MYRSQIESPYNKELVYGGHVDEELYKQACIQPEVPVPDDIKTSVMLYLQAYLVLMVMVWNIKVEEIQKLKLCRPPAFSVVRSTCISQPSCPCTVVCNVVRAVRTGVASMVYRYLDYCLKLQMYGVVKVKNVMEVVSWVGT